MEKCILEGDLDGLKKINIQRLSNIAMVHALIMSQKHRHITKYLIQKYITYDRYEDVLYKLAKYKKITFIKFLVENFLINNIRDVLEPFLHYGPIEMIEYLLDKMVYISEMDYRRFVTFAAVKKNVLKYMVDNSPKYMNSIINPNRLLYHNVQRCHINLKVIKYIVSIGGDINSRNIIGEVLRTICGSSNERLNNNMGYRIVKYFIKQNGNFYDVLDWTIDVSDFLCIINIQLIKLLIKAGAKIKTEHTNIQTRAYDVSKQKAIFIKYIKKPIPNLNGNFMIRKFIMYR